MSKIHLLVIDAQWDFCHEGDPNYDPANPNPDPMIDFVKRPGALPVQGAQEDCIRAAEMIRKGIKKIDDISVTMDSHRPLHIAHADFWRDDQGNMPTPFADIITTADITGKNRKWHTYNPAFQEWAEKVYCPGLEKRGRNALCIWPKHCIWGTQGWALYPCVQEAIQEWCEKEQAIVNVCFKGQNVRTEWYSAVAAEIEDPKDPQTALNTDFVETFRDADLFVFLGQALSHCMLWTFMDIVDYLGEKFVKKCLLIEDATSPVPLPPCVQASDEFLRKYKSMGMQTCTAAEFVSDV